MPRDPDLPLLISREVALAAGLTRHQVTQRLRCGRWHVVRRGWYVDSDRLADADPREQHLLRLCAALALRGDRDVASHLSAAAVLGWPAPFDGFGPVTVTSTDLQRSARRREGLVVQVATTPPSDVLVRHVDVGGERIDVRLTSPARTAADCLRHLPREDAVAVVDAAVRGGATTACEIQRVLDRQEPWPYLARGRGALELVDPRHESYLESYSFARLARAGIRSEPQVVVRDETGQFVARVDGWIGSAAVALECDGRGKYLGAADDPTDVDDVARSVRSTTRDEMRREQRLQRLGVAVVRWGTADVVRRPEQVTARIRAAVHRERGAFTGSATPTGRA
ncbi:hypothetical protein GCM10027446_12440 [Angustibacter peucedani]